MSASCLVLFARLCFDFVTSKTSGTLLSVFVARRYQGNDSPLKGKGNGRHCYGFQVVFGPTYLMINE
jgi:hypothetical protein